MKNYRNDDYSARAYTPLAKFIILRWRIETPYVCQETAANGLDKLIPRHYLDRGEQSYKLIEEDFRIFIAWSHQYFLSPDIG